MTTEPILLDPSKVKTKDGDTVINFAPIKNPLVWEGLIDNAYCRWTADGTSPVSDNIDMDNEAWLHPGDLCLFYDDDITIHVYREFSHMDDSALFPFIDIEEICWSRAKKIMPGTELQKLLSPKALEEKK